MLVFFPTLQSTDHDDNEFSSSSSCVFFSSVAEARTTTMTSSGSSSAWYLFCLLQIRTPWRGKAQLLVVMFFSLHVSFRSHHHDEPELVIVLVFFPVLQSPGHDDDELSSLSPWFVVISWAFATTTMSSSWFFVVSWTFGTTTTMSLACRHGFFFQHCKG